MWGVPCPPCLPLLLSILLLFSSCYRLPCHHCAAVVVNVTVVIATATAGVVAAVVVAVAVGLLTGER